MNRSGAGTPKNRKNCDFQSGHMIFILKIKKFVKKRPRLIKVYGVIQKNWFRELFSVNSIFRP